MSNVNIQLSIGGNVVGIEHEGSCITLTRDEAMDLLERLPSVIAQMPVSQEKETK